MEKRFHGCFSSILFTFSHKSVTLLEKECFVYQRRSLQLQIKYFYRADSAPLSRLFYRRSLIFCLPPRSSWMSALSTQTEVSWFELSTPLMREFMSAWPRNAHTSPTLLSASRYSSLHKVNWMGSLRLGRTPWWSCAVVPSPVSATKTTWEWWALPSAPWRSTAIPCGWRRGRRGCGGEAWVVANGNISRR